MAQRPVPALKLNVPAVYLRVRASGAAAKARLIDHDHVVDQFRAHETPMPSRILGRTALGSQQARPKNVMHERRFSRAADAGHTDQPAEREADVDVLEVVFRRAFDAQRTRRRRRRARVRVRNASSAQQVVGRQRARRARELARASVEDHLATVLAGAGADVENAVRALHDLGIVLHDDQRIARIAQFAHDAYDAIDVARM